MGGLAFVGRTVPVDIDRVNPTLNHFHRSCLIEIGINDYACVGSTGKKQISNDLDIAVEFNVNLKSTMRDRLVSILGNSNVKLVGNNIGVCYPIRNNLGDSEGFTQIDIMLVSNLRDACWLMRGTGVGIKGVYRNLLLSYVAKIRSEENPSYKFSIGFPAGLMISKYGMPAQRITDPQLILKSLQIQSTPQEAETFEDLCDSLLGSSNCNLEGFFDYISPYVKSKSSSEEAIMALNYLSSKLS